MAQQIELHDRVGLRMIFLSQRRDGVAGGDLDQHPVDGRNDDVLPGVQLVDQLRVRPEQGIDRQAVLGGESPQGVAIVGDVMDDVAVLVSRRRDR